MFGKTCWLGFCPTLAECNRYGEDQFKGWDLALIAMLRRGISILARISVSVACALGQMHIGPFWGGRKPAYKIKFEAKCFTCWCADTYNMASYFPALSQVGDYVDVGANHGRRHGAQLELSCAILAVA